MQVQIYRHQLRRRRKSGEETLLSAKKYFLKFEKEFKTIYMSSVLKKELLEKIAATEDEDLLLLLNEDYEFFSKKNESITIIDGLSADQLAELSELVNEPFGHETESYEDFKKATERWRTK